jgi:hypothetical protein
MTYEGVEYHVDRKYLVEVSNLSSLNTFMHNDPTLYIPKIMRCSDIYWTLYHNRYDHSGCASSITQALQVIKLKNIGEMMANS